MWPLLRACLLSLGLLGTAPMTHAERESAWALPEAGDCKAARDAEGARAFPFTAGERIRFEDLGRLKPFLPRETSDHIATLFDLGMDIEVGPCFRRYAPPEAFLQATRQHAGQARLQADGGLEGVPAGLPFPPEAIAPDDADAGRKWAWNVERRHRGAGRFGDIRMTYVSDGQETAHLEGEYFVAQLLGRSDLPPPHRPRWAGKQRWVSGGRTKDPASSRRCAFRHMRRADAEGDPEVLDDVFFRSTAMHRPTRVGWDPEYPLLSCGFERGFYLPRGGRVGRHTWRVAGVQDLLVPINAATPAYPDAEDRDFGLSGASLARDRWELRRALVLETGRPESPSIRRYVDLETLFPLYHAEAPGLLSQFAGRWSGDRADYPLGEDGQPIQVIDPVLHVQLSPSGEVIRFETWDTVATLRKGSLRRLVSSSALERER